MSEVYEWTFSKVIEESASDAPTPGGGSVSAMVASLGTAMVAMVSNLTIGKEKYADVQDEVTDIKDQTYKLLANIEELVTKDMAAFGEFMRVIKMPKDSEEQKQKRTEEMQKAYIFATDTPLEIARTCLEALKLADKLAGIGNKGAISDVGVAAYVGEASLKSALLSVDINLPGIKDKDYVAKASQEKEVLISQSEELRAKVIKVVQDRIK